MIINSTLSKNYIYIPFPGLWVMQSSSNELSTLVSGKAKCKKIEANTKCLIIPEMTYVTCGLSGKILGLT